MLRSRRPASDRARGGFTIMEIMIAMTVLALGITGIMSLQMSSLRASAYTRHAAEASVLAEDRLELLRTTPVAALADGEDRVDELGIPRENGRYLRTWTVAASEGLLTLTVTVSWSEGGAPPHTARLVTRRSANE